MKNVTDASTDELARYDAVVFGCSMWGDCELQDDFIEFHAALSGISWIARGQRSLVRATVRIALAHSARQLVFLRMRSRDAALISLPSVSRSIAMWNLHSGTRKRGV
ncbi:MAG: hypothetical protein U9N46_14350 [Euryarchaeota archaeon]|nr:hypothetical protein [Euryarchaeota archaeon]